MSHRFSGWGIIPYTYKSCAAGSQVHGEVQAGSRHTTAHATELFGLAAGAVVVVSQGQQSQVALGQPAAAAVVVGGGGCAARQTVLAQCVPLLVEELALCVLLQWCVVALEIFPV